MIHLASVLLLQNIGLSAVVIVAIVGFIIGFLRNFQQSGKSSKKLTKLRKDSDIDRQRIAALNEKIALLEKKTLV